MVPRMTKFHPTKSPETMTLARSEWSFCKIRNASSRVILPNGLPPFWCEGEIISLAFFQLTLLPIFAYTFRVPDDPKTRNTLVIAASLIAAVRTAKEEKIEQSPRVISRVSDSVRLAKMVLRRIEREEEGI